MISCLHGKLAFIALCLTNCSTATATSEPQPDTPPHQQAQVFFKTYCFECHQGKRARGGVDLHELLSAKSMVDEAKAWQNVMARVQSGEMPPQGKRAPNSAQREAFVSWVHKSLRSAACDDGISPGPAPLRRLNRTMYAATIRDLLNVHFDAGADLPADGAGGEGFDNAAETLSLSPIHVEKYLEAARKALNYAAKDPRSRKSIFIVEPNDKISEEEAARQIIEDFLPRAFRRPVAKEEVQRYLALFRHARRDEPFDQAILFALQGALISPHFHFLIEEPNHQPQPRLLNDFALATRLSYFVWASMPDRQLFRLASEGKLNNPQTLRQQVTRMLKDRKAREFAESFVEQWLGTRELGRDIKPDQEIYRRYNEELQSAIKYEPVLFFQDILAENHSLLQLLNSDFTYLNNQLVRHYGLKIKGLGQQMKRTDLPKDSHRGGVLSMAAVLAVSSYPHRTSPVLRGKWVLESILGTPPPPPPPNVPPLAESKKDAPAETVRERLTLHRQNPTCASCHHRIDPIGFGLENYDAIGRWRTTEAGKPIDNKGRLPDGSFFEGPEELKELLLTKHKDQFVLHFTKKMLGYALGRSLALEDECVVDEIAERLKRNNYQAQVLIQEIVISVPFRYQPGTDPTASAVPVKRESEEKAK